MTDAARRATRRLLIINGVLMVALIIGNGYLLVQQYNLAELRRALAYSCGYLDGASRVSGLPAAGAPPRCAVEAALAKSHGFNP